MTLKDIEEMTRERIGTKEIAALYGMSPGDVLRKAQSRQVCNMISFAAEQRFIVTGASILPVLDGLQAIGRGNSDMLPGLATLAFGLVLVLAGIAGYIAVREEDEHENNA